MPKGETSQEHDLCSPVGKLRVTWELYRPNFGSTVAIQTGKNGCPTPQMARPGIVSRWATLTFLPCYDELPLPSVFHVPSLLLHCRAQACLSTSACTVSHCP